jgi:hypothetical protein
MSAHTTKQENQVEHLGKCSRTTRFGTKARRITANYDRKPAPRQL